MTIFEHIKKQHREMKDKSKKERWSYFLDYYKWHALAVLLAIAILVQGIVSIVNLFGLQSVYIGGTVRLLGEPFIQLIRELLSSRFRIITNTQTVQCDLFDDDLEASRKAAVTLTMERLFQRT